LDEETIARAGLECQRKKEEKKDWWGGAGRIEENG
jgi:hypothetical protein